MGGGDLNLKKSWHPGLMKNQKKVWEKEQEALEERRKIKERQLEIQKEKEIRELQELQYARTGVKPKENKLGWMYDDPTANRLEGFGHDDYLLGKKKIDNELIHKDVKREPKKSGVSKVVNQFVALSDSELAARQREDPMFRIKYERMKKESQQGRTRERSSERRRERSPERRRQRSTERNREEKAFRERDSYRDEPSYGRRTSKESDSRRYRSDNYFHRQDSNKSERNVIGSYSRDHNNSYDKDTNSRSSDYQRLSRGERY